MPGRPTKKAEDNRRQIGRRLVLCAGCVAWCGIPAAVALATGIAGAAPSDLHEAYLDADGVLRWTGSQREVALFGVNYYPPFAIDYRGIAELGLDHHRVIDRDVAHFQRLGLTAIRLHVWDREISDADGHLVDNDHLELLDYLIDRCARRGIYTVLTPIAWWGTPNPSAGFSNRWKTKPEFFADPVARKAQCTYLREFMSHVNRYRRKRYADDPAIVAVELINEPLYPSGTTVDEVVEYIDALAAAVKAAGCRKPLFYNGWGGFEAAVARAHVDGCSFGWYPTGLGAGRALRENFLPAVDDYPRMRLPVLAGKAKIVYEFDAADLLQTCMYPAMARAFRSGGAQIAAQFQYDPMPLAPYNYGWDTHYLNLICTPGKAVSLAIAAEVFRRIPRLTRFGKYPTSTRFGPFRVDYERDLSEMNAPDAFMYSNDTSSEPVDPQRLRRIVGCGSSPVAAYDGLGAYFLDRLGEGMWRLEVYPDAVIVGNPFDSARLEREVTRVLCRPHRMRIRLPDLGEAYFCRKAGEAAARPQRAREGAVTVPPGVYVLSRSNDLQTPGAVSYEFHALHPRYARPAAFFDLPPVWRQGTDLRVFLTVASEKKPSSVTLLVRPPGGELAPTPLAAEGPYHFGVTVPGDRLVPGQWEFQAEVRIGERVFRFPRGAGSALSGPAPSPFTVFRADRDAPAPSSGEDIRRKTGGYDARIEIVPGDPPAVRLTAEGFGPEPHAVGWRLAAAAPPATLAPKFNAVSVCARALRPDTDSFELGLIQKNGAAFGTDVPLGPEWNVTTVALERLRRLWRTRGSMDLSQLKEISLVFGAWLYGVRADRPHGFEVAWVRLLHRPTAWSCEVRSLRSPAPLFIATQDPVRIKGGRAARVRKVLGPNGGTAVEIGSPGFGPPPDCVSFRTSVGDRIRAWRDMLPEARALVVVARAREPETTGVEIALIEQDGTPWGAVVPLETSWKTIRVPLDSLHCFKHWSGVPEKRGGADDRIRPGRVAAVNVCFGAWLYGTNAGRPHSIQIAEIALAP